MSIGRRFVKLVRSNLNSLLDKADDGDRSSSSRLRIENLSDEEIEAELRRRESRRSAARRAADQTERAGSSSSSSSTSSSSSSSSFEREAWAEVEEAIRGSSRYRTAGRRPRRTGRHEPARRRTSGRENQLAKLYAQLECPYGSDINTVRKQYRVMMRKYHPDMHSLDPAKQRLATELSQRLTQAYNELRRSVS